MKTKLIAIMALCFAFSPVCLADAPGASEGAGAAGTLLIGLVGFIIAIFWIVFPFIVISKCNQLIRELKKISGDTAQLIRRPANSQA